MKTEIFAVLGKQANVENQIKEKDGAKRERGGKSEQERFGQWFLR